MKRIYRIAPAVAALLVLCAFAAAPVLATPAVIKVTNLNSQGSNQKYYNPSQAASDSVNDYSFAVPVFLESLTVTFTADSGVTVTGEGGTVESKGTSHKVEILIKEDKNTATATLSGNGLTRTLKFTVNRSKDRVPRFESVALMDSSGNEIKREASSTDDAAVYIRETGLRTLKLEIVARDEGEVILINETTSSDGKLIGPDPEDADKPLENPLELEGGKYRRASLTLIEGTNVFRVQVVGGEIVKERELTVIVGDKNANAVGASPVLPDELSPSDPVSESEPEVSPADLPPVEPSRGISPVMWIIIAVIAVVVVGMVVFIAVNMSSSRQNRYGGYDGYDDGYDNRRRRGSYDDYGDGGRYGSAPLSDGRRNLGDYADDFDDDDDYGEYIPRRAGRYDEDDDDLNPPRRGRSRYDTYNQDFDDEYEDGGGYRDGGYNDFRRY